MINNSVKLQDTNINVQKSVAFLYTNNEAAESEIKKTIPFIAAPKIIKYLGINLIKDVEDLYLENYKTLMKEIEKDTKTFHAHGLEEQMLLKCLYHPKQSIDLMHSLSKYQ